MKTVPVQVECRACGHHYRTQVRGGNTRCPECRASRYVRRDQEWEGPVPETLAGTASRAERVGARAPVWVECRCGNAWQSRAKDRTTLRCPECGTGVRVPHRTHDNTGPTDPREVRTAPPRPRIADRPPAPAAWEEDDTPDTTATPRPVLPAAAPGGFLANLLRAMQTPTPAGPPRPVPAPARPSRPAAPPRPAPVAPVADPGRDRLRRDRMCQITATARGRYRVWYDQPPGTCEALDTSLRREEQRCPASPARAVTFTSRWGEDGTAYACLRHAPCLAEIADDLSGVSAHITPLR